MVVAIWALVGLFWAGVIFNAWINRSARRKFKRKAIGDRVFWTLLDIVEWVRTKIFRREPVEAKMLRKSGENPETRYKVVAMMAEVGVRVLYVQENGEWVLKVHNEDAAKVPAAVAELERRNNNMATVTGHRIYEES